MSTVQFFQITTEGAVNGDSPALQTLVNRYRNASDNTMTLWAPQHEDGKVAGIATVWASHDAQKAWESSEAGQSARSDIKKLSTGELYDDTVLFSEDAIPVLKAKVVELVSWIHPADQIAAKKREIEEGFKKFQTAITQQSPEADGGLVSGWGQGEFDFKGVLSRRFTLLIGWKSVEAHYACKKTKPFTDNIHWLRGYGHSEVVMVHYAYSQSLPT
ncbi:hypothetical protein ANO14919_082560 [Xylariales sp. No.14919]|nr:hypothetical protein ANO14919_082560 [Xylariales sp. No.14919]